jgi:glutamyl-tRNA reductase
MPFLALGLNHRTAAVDLRETVAFPTPEAVAAGVRALVDGVDGVDEALLVSTCNRTEIYAITADTDDAPVREWLIATRGGERAAGLAGALYAHWDGAAARHLARVAAGLDSQVIGEPQILGQVKDALQLARTAGTAGSRLERLVTLSLGLARRVRTNTDLGRHPISVAFAAVSLAEQIFGDLAPSQALLLGAGDTVELLARHLRERGVTRFVIANRTVARAQALARLVGGEATSLTDLGRHLAHTDIVIAATGSPLPVLGKGTVEAALRARRRRPIFMVDIAVPRDIEPQVAELSDVYLYTIDDLSEIIANNLKSRRAAAEQAERLIEVGIETYRRELRSESSEHALKRFRSHAEAIRAAELERALAELARGSDPRALLERLARSLTNKLLHRPTVALRKAGTHDQEDVARIVHELFDLGADAAPGAAAGDGASAGTHSGADAADPAAPSRRP